MSRTAPITITVNGRPATAPAGIRIPDFLRAEGLDPQRVVVEWNGRAQTRAESAAVALSEGDTLEIVRIVAGG